MSELKYKNEIELGNFHDKLLEEIVRIEDKNYTSGGLFFAQCLNEIHDIMQSMMKFSDSFSLDHSAVSFLLMNASVLKTTLEIILHTPNDMLYLRQKFPDIFNSLNFFDCLISVLIRVHPSNTLLFALTEVLSIFILVSYKFSCSQSYLHKLQCCMNQDIPNLKIYLYLMYHLVLISQDYFCEHFHEFLCGTNGVLRNDFLSIHLFNSETDIKILTLKIFKSLLSVKESEIVRFKLLQNINLFDGFSKTVKSFRARGLFWNFLRELLPFYNIHDNYDLVPTSASKFILEEIRYINVEDITLRNFKGDLLGGARFSPAIVNLVLNCVTWVCKSDDSNCDDVILVNLRKLQLLITHKDASSATISTQIIIVCFMEDDEGLVDFLLLQLELYCICQQRIASSIMKESFIFNPFELFLEVMDALSYDSSILLDWLLSNETKFLQYFIRYLRILESSWKDFIKACNNKDDKTPKSSTSNGMRTCDCSISTLIKLKTSIKNLAESNLFPYCPTPLLKRLNTIESIFESKVESR
ncbi:uncharacterized protein LOC120341018 isoform X1 [Styela clava]